MAGPAVGEGVRTQALRVAAERRAEGNLVPMSRYGCADPALDRLPGPCQSDDTVDSERTPHLTAAG